MAGFDDRLREIMDEHASATRLIVRAPGKLFIEKLNEDGDPVEEAYEPESHPFSFLDSISKFWAYHSKSNTDLSSIDLPQSGDIRLCFPSGRKVHLAAENNLPFPFETGIPLLPSPSPSPASMMSVYDRLDSRSTSAYGPSPFFRAMTIIPSPRGRFSSCLTEDELYVLATAGSDADSSGSSPVAFDEEDGSLAAATAER